MPLDGLARDLLQSHALDLGVGAGEIFGDKIGPEAHRIEDLRAAIGLIGEMPIFDMTLSRPLSVALM